MDSTIRIWRASDGGLVRVITGHTSGVLTVAFSPDGSLVASGGNDQTVRLWRVSDGRLMGTLVGHTSWINSVAFSSDGTLIVSASGDAEIRLWSVSNGSLMRTYNQETVSGVLSIQFSPNSRSFAYGRGDATIVLARNPFWQVGDVNGDGCVDNSDLLRVLLAFGQTDRGLEDMNSDGVVDDADLLAVLFNFGSGC
jgi:WD40 repeat protein